MNSKVRFGFCLAFAALCGIIGCLASGGWIALTVYTIDANGNIEEAYVLHSGLRSFWFNFNNYYFSGTLPNESDLGPQINHELVLAANYVWGFGTPGIVFVFVSLILYLVGTFKLEKARFKAYSVIGLFLGGALVTIASILFAFQLGLDYSYLIFTFCSFSVLIASVFMAYGIATDESSPSSVIYTIPSDSATQPLAKHAQASDHNYDSVSGP
jgi:hypothetical protein